MKYDKEIRARFIRRFRRCKKIGIEIEEFIEGIGVSKIRLVFQLR
ncbi:MAG: hypothetical protein ACLVEW_06695 [Peptoniphilus sp.]